MGLLTAKNLLSKEVLKKEKVVLDTTVIEPEVSHMDGKKKIVDKEAVVEENYVFVRQMTAHEKNTWEMSQLEKVGTGNKAQYNVTLDDYKAKLAVVCVCDEDGILLFTPDDYKTLSKNISALKLEKIVDIAQKLNAISEEDREAITKNS